MQEGGAGHLLLLRAPRALLVGIQLLAPVPLGLLAAPAGQGSPDKLVNACCPQEVSKVRRKLWALISVMLAALTIWARGFWTTLGLRYQLSSSDPRRLAPALACLSWAGNTRPDARPGLQTGWPERAKGSGSGYRRLPLAQEQLTSEQQEANAAIMGPWSAFSCRWSSHPLSDRQSLSPNTRGSHQSSPRRCAYCPLPPRPKS